MKMLLSLHKLITSINLYTLSACGFINKKDLISDSAETCDKLGISSCNIQMGENFFNLYAAENRKLRIGCGCFTLQK